MKGKLLAALAFAWIFTTGAAAPVKMTPVKVADGVYMLEHSRGSGNSTVVMAYSYWIFISITPIKHWHLSARAPIRKLNI
ncbi:MAG: hypothetical protein GEU77_11735 [Deltaproteobacteria bacterium]|nr:hypothetical protein [Deltaproteobacteria bacterium]